MAQPGTTLDYGARLERVLAYLADNLDREVGLDRLADVACFSPFHFHRIFHALQGETVAEAVRRLRLQRAAVELIEQETPIARIAARAGYGSQAAFTRAFRSAYGAPPAVYRATATAPFEHAAVTVRDDVPVDVVALRLQGDYERIGGTFERLHALAAARGWVTEATRYFGVYYHDPAATAAADLRSDACLSAPPGFEGEGDLRPLTLAGGRHAVLLHVGPYAELDRAYTWLYREWLPTSGAVPADRPCVEEYLNNPRQVPPSELRTEIWLPLEDGRRRDPPTGVLPVR